MSQRTKSDRARPTGPGHSGRSGGAGSAFTLLELLVVIGIIAILAGMAVPAFRGFGESNILEAARRQLLDDLAMARQKAISERTTVFMLFVPPFELNEPTEDSLWGGQYRTYALYSKRSVGDQPGRERPRFLTEWRSLPDGMVFCVNKFQEEPMVVGSPSVGTNIVLAGLRYFDGVNLKVQYPVPPRSANDVRRVNDAIRFRYLAFNARGQMGYFNNNGVFVVDEDQMLTFQKGSVVYEKDLNTGLYNINVPADLMVEANGVTNYIRINAMNGRATLLKPEI